MGRISCSSLASHHPHIEKTQAIKGGDADKVRDLLLADKALLTQKHRDPSAKCDPALELDMVGILRPQHTHNVLGVSLLSHYHHVVQVHGGVSRTSTLCILWYMGNSTLEGTMSTRSCG